MAIINNSTEEAEMPWQTVRDNGISLQFPTGGIESLRVVFDPAGNDIAYVVPDHPDQGNCNAAMIAAAPEMFNACRRLWDAVVDDCAMHDIPIEVLIAAFECRRAVVKAVGGKSYERMNAEDWARKQDRERQRRCRARKNASKEATDGTAQG